RGYVKLLAEVILEMSRQEEVVILGAGGQVILQDHPQALHVRIVAPQERRLERMQELGLGQRAEAIQALRQSDAARSGYLHVYFDRDINDALLYHLVLNAGRLSLEDIVDLLVRRVQRLEDADHA
ncbi:MAG: cytidylate kinase family protein, partial [Chloroflexia bacterium]|nr:cytidylate kinase family protein [Chloroflexia bacterium]